MQLKLAYTRLAVVAVVLISLVGCDQATKVVASDGAIKFDIEHRVRAVYGRQLGIAGANGGYTYVALFYRNNRLYQIEGNAFVAGGQAEIDAMRFQQSLDLT